MKKFLALYMAPMAEIDAMMKNSAPGDMKKGMDEWSQWMKRHGKMVVDMGAPTGKNTRVTAQGAANTRNEVCGYSVVTADSREAAAAMFADCPHLAMMQNAYIEVLDLLEM